MKLASVTILLLSALLFACNNDGNEPDDNPNERVYDTIRPNAYLPYYPNSWWLYQVNDTGFTTTSTSADYTMVTFRNGMVGPADTVMLPIIEGFDFAVYGYNYIGRNPLTGYYELVEIFSEKVGDLYHYHYLCDGRWDYGCWYQKTTGKFKIGEDSVITTEVFYSSFQEPYIDKIKFYYTYTKDIGITAYYKVDTVTQDTLYWEILADYFIDKK